MAANLKIQLSQITLLFFLYILSSVSPIGSSSDNENDGLTATATVYEILPKFGLPRGLLPDAVKSYYLSSDDGSFVVEMERRCYVHFDYLVYYEKRITGMIKYGSITKLHGIQVQRLLFWFDVDEITVDLPPSDSIYFQVGFISKKLHVDQFKTVHSCHDNLSASSRLPSSSDENQVLVTE